MSILGRLFGAALAPVAMALPPMPPPLPAPQPRRKEQQKFDPHAAKRYHVMQHGRRLYAHNDRNVALDVAKKSQRNGKTTVFDTTTSKPIWTAVPEVSQHPKGQVARIRAERARQIQANPAPLTRVPHVVMGNLTWSALPGELLRSLGYSPQAKAMQQAAKLQRLWLQSPELRKQLEDAMKVWQWRGLMRLPNGTRVAQPEWHRWEGSRLQFSEQSRVEILMTVKAKPVKVKALKPVRELKVVAAETAEAIESLRKKLSPPVFLVPEPIVAPIVEQPVDVKLEKSPAEREAEELAWVETKLAEEAKAAEEAKRKRDAEEEAWLQAEIEREEKAKAAKSAKVVEVPVVAAPRKAVADAVVEKFKNEIAATGGAVIEGHPAFEELDKALVPPWDGAMLVSATVEVVEKRKVGKRKAADGVTGDVMRAWCKELGLSIVAGATLVGVSESTLRRMK